MMIELVQMTELRPPQGQDAVLTEAAARGSPDFMAMMQKAEGTAPTPPIPQKTALDGSPSKHLLSQDMIEQALFPAGLADTRAPPALETAKDPAAEAEVALAPELTFDPGFVPPMAVAAPGPGPIPFAETPRPDAATGTQGYLAMVPFDAKDRRAQGVVAAPAVPRPTDQPGPSPAEPAPLSDPKPPTAIDSARPVRRTRPTGDEDAKAGPSLAKDQKGGANAADPAADPVKPKLDRHAATAPVAIDPVSRPDAQVSAPLRSNENRAADLSARPEGRWPEPLPNRQVRFAQTPIARAPVALPDDGRVAQDRAPVPGPRSNHPAAVEHPPANDAAPALRPSVGTAPDRSLVPADRPRSVAEAVPSRPFPFVGPADLAPLPAEIRMLDAPAPTQTYLPSRQAAHGFRLTEFGPPAVDVPPKAVPADPVARVAVDRAAKAAGPDADLALPDDPAIPPQPKDKEMTNPQDPPPVAGVIDKPASPASPWLQPSAGVEHSVAMPPAPSPDAGSIVGPGPGENPDVPSALPAASPPRPAEPLTTQVASLIVHRAEDRAELLLEPAELGRMRFEITHRGDGVQILLSAERPETLDLLRRNAEQLTGEFRAMGFGSADLGFGSWGGGQTRTEVPHRAETAVVADPDPATLPHPPVARALTTASGGLDLRL